MTADAPEQPCMCKQLAMPRPILTYPRLRKWAGVFFLAGIATNLAGGLLPLRYPAHGESIQTSGWAATGILMTVAFILLQRMYSYPEPKRGKLIYMSGRVVRVRFRPDPDRPEGVYRAHRRTGPWPWSPLAPYDDAHHLATVVIRSGQLHHALRIGESMVPLYILAKVGMEFDSGPDLD